MYGKEYKKRLLFFKKTFLGFFIQFKVLKVKDFQERLESCLCDSNATNDLLLTLQYPATYTTLYFSGNSAF